MGDVYTCACGEETRICRYEVTNEQWATFETFYRMAYDWALDHLPTSDESRAEDEAEAFACRFAGEMWDDDEPYSFPAYLRSIQADAERAQAKQREIDLAEQRADARRRDAKWRAQRRRAARNT